MARLDLSELRARPLDELVDLADFLPNAGSLPRAQLVIELLRQDGQGTGSGVLEVLPDGFGFLRDTAAHFVPGAEDVYVSPSQIRRFDLQDGDRVDGLVRAPKDNERYFALIKVHAVNGADPDESRAALAFAQLTPASATTSWVLEHDGDLTGRALDLVAPLGRGQRALLRCPARAGRTRVLESIARGLLANRPDAHVFLLLLATRPEDLREVSCASPATVVGTTFDESAARHIQVATMIQARAERLVGHGHDVVILLDSLTALARAGALTAPVSGRLLAPGLDAAGLAAPQKLFAAARDTVEGGSLTVVAAARTGTVADDAVLDALGDAATWDVALDASCAARRVFPALDLARSANHRLDHVVGAQHAAVLDDLRARTDSIDSLLAELRSTKSNRAVLDGLDNRAAAGH